jgi:hypothetical protein
MATTLTPTITAPNPLAAPTAPQIPQSAAPPAGMLQPFEDPREADRRQHNEAMAKWFSENRRVVDEGFLDPAKAFADIPQGFADSIDQVRMLAANDDLLRLYNQGEDPPADELGRYLLRLRVAEEEFKGQGAESEEAFFQKGKEKALRRVDTATVIAGVVQQARQSAILDLLNPGEFRNGWVAARNSAMSLPGYDPAEDGELFHAYSETMRDEREKMKPYVPQLLEMIQSFKDQEGSGPITATLKEGTAMGVLGAMFGEKPQTSRTAWEIWQSMAPEQRPEFEQAIGILARALPEDQQQTFWGNVMTSGGRYLEKGLRDAFNTARQISAPAEFDRLASEIGRPGVGFPEEADSARELRDRLNFQSRMVMLREQVVDPVKEVSEGPVSRFFERMAYGTPGAIMSSAAAMYAAPLLAASLTESHYQSMLQRRMDAGDSYEKADKFAAQAAPAGMALEFISEKLGAKLLGGELPYFNKALTRIMDRIENPIGRMGARFAAGGTQEGLTEVSANYIDAVVQDLGYALGADVGPTKWLGENGEFQGDWAENLDTFALGFPLAFFGIRGSFGRDARVKAFAEASDLEMKAVGYQPGDISNIRAGIARGLNSGETAINAAYENVNPNSPEAKAAAEELAARERARREAAGALRASGDLPIIVAGREGYTVLDGRTEETVGTAPSMGAAWTMAQAHSDFLADLDADAVAYMKSLLESADFVQKLDPNQETRLELGTVMDRALLEAERPEMAARFAKQVELKEQAAGGTGEISYTVNGWSESQIRDNLRQTVNRIFQGGSVLTVFHEFTHGRRRALREAGQLSREEEVSFVRAIDAVLAGKRTREGERLSFLPEGITDEQITEEMIDEAISEVMEMEILRSRSGGTKRRMPQRPGAGNVPSGFVTRNLTALARLAPEATRKFSAFIESVRAHFGQALARALAIKKAEREGKFDADSYDAFLAKLLGLDVQDDFNRQTAQEAARIADPLSPEAFAAALNSDYDVDADDIPFSIARSGMRYPEFRLSQFGPVPSLTSNTGVLYPDGHEIDLSQNQAPAQIPDGGGEFWNQLSKDGRHAAVLGAWEAYEGRGLAEDWIRPALIEPGANPTDPSVTGFWNWLRDTLNSDFFRGIDPVDTMDLLVDIFQLEWYASERDSGFDQHHYMQIAPDGTVLALRNDTGQARFARLPDPSAQPELAFSLGRSTPQTFANRLLDKIGEQALRAEQPKAKYEDKRQLLLDFAESILNPAAEKSAQTGNVSRRTFGPLQVIRERFAQKLQLDPQIRFIGETLTDLTDFVERAQALRNPLFETFYVIAIKRGETSDKVLDVRAYTSRCPCAAAVTDHAKGVLAGITEQAGFLKSVGADELYLLHNHPSGDSTPSSADLALTRKYHAMMQAEGIKLRGHVVINHREFHNITVEDTGGGVLDAVAMPGELADTGRIDPYAWPLFDSSIGKQIDDPSLVAALGREVGAAYTDPETLIGFITDNRHKVVAVLAGSIDDFMGLTNAGLQNYAREQGGVSLMLHGKEDSQSNARRLLRRFATANQTNRVFEMVVEYPGGYVSGLSDEGYKMQRMVDNDRFFGGEGNPAMRVQENSISLGRATVTPTASTRAFQGAAGSPSAIGPAAFSIGAWHGTPHKITSRMSLDKIGTGEGAQAYGWGLYFANALDVAKNYMENTESRAKVQYSPVLRYEGQRVDALDWPAVKKRAASAIDSMGKARAIVTATDRNANELLAAIESIDETKLSSGLERFGAPTGNLYRVELDVEQDDLLDWDKPLSEQSEKVRKIFDALDNTPPEGFRLSEWLGLTMKGWYEGPGRHNPAVTMYAELTKHFGRADGQGFGGEASRKASELLAAAGIRGIRYLDGNSRRTFKVKQSANKSQWTVMEEITDRRSPDYGDTVLAQGGFASREEAQQWADRQVSYNYVIFDESAIKITEENGVPVDLSEAGGSFSLGRPWPANFPNVVISTTVGKMKSHPNYTAAKAGSVRDAFRVVNDLIKVDRLRELGRQHPGAIVAGLHAEEATGMNRLPEALAEAIAHHGNLELDDELVIINTPKRTGSTAIHRLASRPEFAGQIQAGRQYILADDVATQGGTLSEARAYIEENGGEVVAVVTMGAAQGGTLLAMSEKTRLALEQKFGNDALNEFASDTGLYGGQWQAFTNSEGQAILRYSKLETAADAILAARQAAGPAGAAQPAGQPELIQGRFQGFSLGRPGAAGQLGGIDPNQPGGANIGDAALPSNVVTPEMDAAYLDAVERGDLKQASAMVKSVATELGFVVGPVFHGSPNFEGGALGIPSKYKGMGNYVHKYWFTDNFDLALYYADQNDIDDVTTDLNTSAGKPAVVEFYLKSPTKTLDRRDYEEEGMEEQSPVQDANLQIGRKQGWEIVKIENINDKIDSETVGNSTIYGLADTSFVVPAQPILRDSAGNIIPLSQRFNQSSPADSGAASLAPSRGLDLMRMNALDRVRNPRRRAEIFQRISREFERLKLDAERFELVAGSKRMRKSLLKEAAMREAVRREELENDVYARHWELLSNEDLVRIKSQPVHAALADPDSPLRGRLMSRSAAMKHRAELFGEDYKGGEWDGSDGLSRSIFGGTLTPDQAAQELYDEGLINSPDVDTLWQALHSEQAQVAGMKEQLAQVQQQLRAARTTAKQEANDWLRQAGEGQAANYSPKQEILRALASMQAILRALPPPVRAKIGGIMDIARAGSEEARLAILKDTIAKSDRELEKWMRETLDREFRELLERTRPERDEAGKRPKGKIGANVHDLFRSIEDAMFLDAAETEAEATRLESLAEAEATTAEQAAHLTLEANLVRLVGDWRKADAARREMALAEATSAYAGGYLQAQIKAAQKRERITRRRADLKHDTGRAGERMERVNAEIKARGTKLGRTREALLSIFSFDQMLGLVFGEGSATARSFAEWELRAANAKENAIQRTHNAVEALLNDLAGNPLAGEKLRYKLATERRVEWIDWQGRKQTATEMEAVSYTLWWAQADGRRHMEGQIEENADGSTTVTSDWHWREEDVAAIERQLSKEAKAIRLHLRENYGAEYDRINAVFSDLYGVNMPRHKDYSPIAVAPQHAPGGQMADPVSGTMQGPGLTPGSLKNRSHSAVAEPQRMDALQHYVAHVKQMEHFIAYGQLSSELMAIVNNRELGNSIEAKAGKEALNILRAWTDYFAQGGTRDAAAHLAVSGWFQRGLDRISQMALVGRVSVLAIQSVQLGAATYQMPVGSYLTRLAKLTTGQLGWGKAIRSDYIQRRLAQMPPAVQQAMQGLASGPPSRLKHETARLGSLISGADALFTAGTYAIIYDYQLKLAKDRGMPSPEQWAQEETIRLTDQVAQPMRAGARSLIEVTATNPAFRMMWAFASEPRQKIALSAYGLMQKTGLERFRAAAITWTVSGLLAAVVRAAVRDLRDDGEDDEVFDETNWDPTRLALMALSGPIGGLPIVGKEIENMIYAGAGEYMPGSTLISGPSKAAGTIRKLATGKGSWEDAIKDAESILMGVGVASPTAAAAASWSHIARDLEAIYKNTTED